MCIRDRYYGYRLIGGGHHSAEGPYIQYDAENGYYYLFVAYGDLQRDGGYQIRQFRSEKPTGPYVDVAGNTLEDHTILPRSSILRTIPVAFI